MSIIQTCLNEHEYKRAVKKIKEDGATIIYNLLTDVISDSRGVVKLKGNFYIINITNNYSLVVKILSPKEVRRATITPSEYYIEAGYTLKLQITHNKKGILVSTICKHCFLMTERDKELPRDGVYREIHIGYESCFRDEINSLVLNLHNLMYR